MALKLLGLEMDYQYGTQDLSLIVSFIPSFKTPIIPISYYSTSQPEIMTSMISAI